MCFLHKFLLLSCCPICFSDAGISLQIFLFSQLLTPLQHARAETAAFPLLCDAIQVGAQESSSICIFMCRTVAFIQDGSKLTYHSKDCDTSGSKRSVPVELDPTIAASSFAPGCCAGDLVLADAAGPVTGCHAAGGGSTSAPGAAADKQAAGEAPPADPAAAAGAAASAAAKPSVAAEGSAGDIAAD